MNGWEVGLGAAGMILQVLGLVAAAVGIGKTWAENAAPGESLSERIFGPVIRFIWVKVFRQPPRGVTRHLGSADGAFAFDGSATGTMTRGLRTDASLAEQIQQVKQETDETRLAAATAQAAADRALAAIERTREYVDRQDVAVQETLTRSARRQAVDGIPLAVVGLVFTALGTLVQYVGGFLG